MPETCPMCGQTIRKKRWSPPTLEEVKAYRAANPELRNVDAYTFWASYTKSDWQDTAGKPIRNWKLKMWTWSRHADPVNPKKYEPPKRYIGPPVVKEATEEEKAAIRATSKVFAPKPGPTGKSAAEQKQACGPAG